MNKEEERTLQVIPPSGEKRERSTAAVSTASSGPSNDGDQHSDDSSSGGSEADDSKPRAAAAASKLGDGEAQEPAKKKRRSDGKKHVEKNSLTEAELIEAKLKLKTDNKNKAFMTENEKREERRVANRLSAFQSIQRRKIIIEGLQKTVGELSKENAQMRSELNQLKYKNDLLQQENQLLRSQVAVRPGNAGAAQVSVPQGVPAASSSVSNVNNESSILNLLNGFPNNQMDANQAARLLQAAQQSNGSNAADGSRAAAANILGELFGAQQQQHQQSGIGRQLQAAPAPVSSQDGGNNFDTSNNADATQLLQQLALLEHLRQQQGNRKHR